MHTIATLAIVSFLVFLWVALDNETENVFDAFGVNFIYLWYNSGQRWRGMFMYGWRVLVFFAFTIGCCYLALRYWTINPFDQTSVAKLATSLLFAGIGFLLYPWIKLNRRRRFWNRVRQAVVRMTPFVQRLESDPSIENDLDPAKDECLHPWRAWHPTGEAHRSDLWRDLVPIVYSNQEDGIGVLQMSSCDTFILRSDPTCIETFGTHLPFEPSICKYKIVRSGKIRGCKNWWYLITDLDLDR